MSDDAHAEGSREAPGTGHGRGTRAGAGARPVLAIAVALIVGLAVGLVVAPTLLPSGAPTRETPATAAPSRTPTPGPSPSPTPTATDTGPATAPSPASPSPADEHAAGLFDDCDLDAATDLERLGRATLDLMAADAPSAGTRADATAAWLTDVRDELTGCAAAVDARLDDPATPAQARLAVLRDRLTDGARAADDALRAWLDGDDDAAREALGRLRTAMGEIVDLAAQTITDTDPPTPTERP